MANTDLIKKARSKVNYTKQKAEELQKCMESPLYFMENFIYVQHPVKGRMKFEPYEYQKEMIDVFHNNRYAIALTGRQLGKTTVAAAYLLWYAMFVRDSTILVASKSGGDSREIMIRIRFAYEELPDHIRAGAAEYNKQSIIFDNGSRIVSATTTENTGRGMSITLVYMDEFAFVEQRVAKELWTSLSPTLSTGGKAIITSTPNSDEDTFADIWRKANMRLDEYGNETPAGINGFVPYIADWRRHPDRGEQWASEERGKIGEERFQREHECKFIIFEETLIDSIILAGMRGSQPIRKESQIRWYKDIDSTKTYVVALDPSMGTGGDNAAIQVWELPSMIQVAEWQHNKTAIEGQMKILMSLLKDIESKGKPELYWSIEANTLGEAALVVVRDTGEENFPGTMLHDPVRNTNASGRKRMGFITTNKSKLEACSKMKSLVETGKLKINSGNLLSELKTFIGVGNTFQAKGGCTDDLVMSTILFIRMAQYISMWDDKTLSQINSNIGDDFDDYDAPMPLVFC
jgi:hypothetical protein